MTWSSRAVNYLATGGVILIVPRFGGSDRRSAQVFVALLTVK